MIRLMTGVVAAAFLLTASAANADSWSRSSTGANGGARSTTTSCANGVCERSVEGVGPNGATWSKTGRCGPNACGHTAQGTGPNGQSWSRSGAVVQAPFRGHAYRAVTGPEGNTVMTRRGWRRH